MDKTNHTLVLIQPGGEETRTYSDFDSIKEAMEGICYIFELYIKQSDSNLTTITYDVKQLFDFIDSLKEIVCLVFEETLSTYSAYNKDWIKEKLYMMLRRQIVTK